MIDLETGELQALRWILKKGPRPLSGQHSEGLDTANEKIVAELKVRREEGPVDEDKDYGPEEIGAALGACIGSYIAHDVTKREFLRLVGDMYNGIYNDPRVVEARAKEMKH